MRGMIDSVTEAARRGELTLEVLERSCLRPLLWRQLHTASLLDVGSRPERTSMYQQMLSLLRAIAAWPSLLACLATPCGSEGPSATISVLGALASVRKQVCLSPRLCISMSMSMSASMSTSTSMPVLCLCHCDGRYIRLDTSDGALPAIRGVCSPNLSLRLTPRVLLGL